MAPPRDNGPTPAGKQMQIHPIRFGLPFALFGFPLMLMQSRAEDNTAWLLALGVYFIAGVMTMARYQPVAYRTPVLTLWSQFALNLAIAATLAIAYVLVMTGGIGAVLKLFN